MGREYRLLSLLLIILPACRPQDACSTGDIRLAGGTSYLEGRVEVCYAGVWGTVCDDNWDQPDAKVACRKLGHSDQGSVAVTGNAAQNMRFGQGTGTIHLDDLGCIGDEDDLFKCPLVSDCEHTEDAGLICEEDDVVLVQESQLIPNNSLLPLESLGGYNASSRGPLRCVTTDPNCCLTNPSGNWFLPGSDTPLDTVENSSGLYQSWSDEQSIELNRPSEVTSVEGGLYRCEVPDVNGVTQTLYAGIYSSPNDGILTVTDIRYDTSSQTFTCTSTGGPATTVSWTRGGLPLAVDGTTFETSQILTDISTATYANRLSIVSKSEGLSGVYSCTVGNERSSVSAEITTTICIDGLVRINDANQPPSLEVCRDDRWFVLEANFQVRTEQSVIQNVQVTQMESNSISVSWDTQDTDSITRYDITCSGNSVTSTFHEDSGEIEEAVVTNISPGNYQCCVVAYLDANLLGLVEFTSTECVGVFVFGEANTASVGGLSTVTYALAGLVAVLLVVTIAIAMGCVYVVLSKRKRQVTHPRHNSKIHGKRITKTSSFLVDNPIYKSNSSLISAENGTHANLPLRAVGSDSSVQGSPIHNAKSIAADNPQYGTHLQPPPPKGKAPRYTKVGTQEIAPMYEMINAPATNGVTDCDGNSTPEGGPIYSTPGPIKRELKKGGESTLPLYESAMDIAVPTGKEGDYSKLSHDM